jgi:hypothetical protein
MDTFLQGIGLVICVGVIIVFALGALLMRGLFGGRSRRSTGGGLFGGGNRNRSAGGGLFGGNRARRGPGIPPTGGIRGGTRPDARRHNVHDRQRTTRPQNRRTGRGDDDIRSGGGFG